MFGVTAGLGERRAGLGKGDGSRGSRLSPSEEMRVGGPGPRQKGASQPVWSGGWGCTAARQHPGKKEEFQQRQGHGPGSGRRVSAHTHTTFEVSWFSMASTAGDTVLCHQDLSPGSTPAVAVLLKLGAWRSPCFKTTRHICNWTVGSQHQIHSGPLHVEQDKPPHQKGQTLRDKQCYNKLKAQR